MAEVDATGGRTLHEYTHFDLPSVRTTPDGARHGFGYDTELRLTEVRNTAGHSWSYLRDTVGRIVSETDFDGQAVRYAYDAADRWSSQTNVLGQVVTHHFDDDGLLVAKEVDGTITRLTYDVMGRMTSARSPYSALTIERDDRGRVTAETVDGRTTRYHHDALGRRTGRITPSGSRLWPSAIALDAADGGLLAGTQALHRRRLDPEAYRHDFLRDLGRTHPLWIGGREFPARSCVAALLAALRAEAERLAGTGVHSVVLACPGHYLSGATDPRRNALRRAAREAGLTRTTLVPAPVAAALAPLDGPPFGPGDTVLVYDLGAARSTPRSCTSTPAGRWG
ncbi:Hsp70 family protein [Streptomyces zaomyceticus]|uniref:Hsp70 family protein n=1 Tax=Streptomyces zaomyceticus TaxID=68286 RepID=UPI003F4DB7CE